MKLYLVIQSCLVAVVLAKNVQLYYHENVGIRLAERVKMAEMAADFDGSRIVGGSPAAIGAYPFLAGLIITLSTGSTSICSACLVSATRAVTAAHCWYDGLHQATEVVVVLGSALLFTGGTRIPTSEVVPHEDYNINTLDNDIAVIYISAVSFNENIQPIALASGSNDFVGSWAYAAGFGITDDSEGITTDQFMSHVRLRVITTRLCRLFYGNTLMDTTLCTSGFGRVGVCGGDSGGPLVLDGQLIGVASFVSAYGCTVGLPSGFVRVTSFEPWIRARM